MCSGTVLVMVSGAFIDFMRASVCCLPGRLPSKSHGLRRWSRARELATQEESLVLTLKLSHSSADPVLQSESEPALEEVSQADRSIGLLEKGMIRWPRCSRCISRNSCLFLAFDRREKITLSEQLKIAIAIKAHTLIDFCDSEVFPLR